jgi:hypothetical protein
MMVVDIRILGIVRNSGGESVEGGLRVSHIHVDACDFDPRLGEGGCKVYRSLNIFFCALGSTTSESVVGGILAS